MADAESGSIKVTPPAPEVPPIPVPKVVTETPKKTAPPEKTPEKVQIITKSVPVTPAPTNVQYRLNIYSHSGLVKQSIPSAIYQDMCRRHGDIMRCIPSSRWVEMDDILDDVWKLEKKMKHPSNRTRKMVELAMAELVEREFVITR